MEQVKLVKFKNPKNTNEIFQSLDIKFAFVNSSYEQISNPIKCRDFLGDCIWSKKTGNKARIYGFEFDYKDTPYDTEVLRMSLTFPNGESQTNFVNNISKLHEREVKVGLSLTKIFTTQDKSILVIEADKTWQSSIWKVSLYTFYLKLISYKNVTELENPEDKYWTTLEPKEDFILDRVYVEEEHLFDEIYSAHNYSGFISCLKKQNPQQAAILGL